MSLASEKQEGSFLGRKHGRRRPVRGQAARKEKLKKDVLTVMSLNRLYRNKFQMSHSLYRRVLGDWRYVFSVLWRADLHLPGDVSVCPRQKSQLREVHSHHPERPLWSGEFYLHFLKHFISKQTFWVVTFFLSLLLKWSISTSWKSPAQLFHFGLCNQAVALSRLTGLCNLSVM